MKSWHVNLGFKILASCVLLLISFVYFTIFNVFGATDSVTYYDYKAKEVISDRKTGITVLKGDVKVIKRNTGNQSNNDYLYADQVTVYMDVQVKDKLIKIEAVGNVDMKEGDLKATCGRAIIYEEEGRIEMECSPPTADGKKGPPAIVDDGKNKIEAPAITYFRTEDRLEAKGDVTGYITIKEKEEKTEEEKEK